MQVDHPTLIFDGDCGFCTVTSRWASTRWTTSAESVAWQTLGDERLHAIGLTEADVRRAVYWVDGRGRIARGSGAVARALLAGNRSMRVAGRLLLTPPVSWLARPGYWLVARYRHHLPGSTDACRR